MLDVNEMKRRREAATLTQEEAGLRAGWGDRATPEGRRYARQRWSDLERGSRPDPQLSTAAAIASALRCRIDDLWAPEES